MNKKGAFEKIERVIDSCTTFEQLKMAVQMVNRFRKYYDNALTAVSLVNLAMEKNRQLIDECEYIKRVEEMYATRKETK